VSGVGRVSLPVRAPLVKKLIAVARPAMFGLGEQTLVDSRVRDTWELTPDQIVLGAPEWTAFLDRTLEHVRDELGLPGTSRLRAEPHSMLVYGKGQLFGPHQDSEKHDLMVGTLVVSLPSAHTGGELVIDHAGNRRTYRASKQELTLVAFYADCRHQVTPVKSGHRVTLTFNLLCDAEAPEQAAEPATELARCVTEHFTEPATPWCGGRSLAPPGRLVFLLDHEYSQRGLNWGRLKGSDAERAALVRAASAQAGCETVLALAEVRETRDALPGDEWEDYSYDEDDDDRDLDAEGGDIQLGELIDDEITLGWWTRPDGTGGEPISLHVRDYEVCATTPSANLEPYQSEYEGYMGNYGNTMDRWYRRAAVVVWPRNRAFEARAEAGSQWALGELRERIKTGDLADARAAAESLAPFWNAIGARADLLGAVLDVAAGLGVAETAAMLLEPFRVEMLAPEHAGGLAAVAGRYGQEWTRGVFGGWVSSGGCYGTGLSEWINDRLPGLCRASRAAERPETARMLAAGAWDWMGGELRLWTATARGDVREPQLAALASPLACLLEVADDPLRDEITGALREYEETVLECLMPALRLADARHVSGFDTVARDCAQRLDAILARPPRDKDDWSIAWTGCGCDLCDTLETFLG
jgi:hypothetical protein